MLRRSRAAVSRLRCLIQRRRLADDLDAELQSHADMLAERYIASGMSPEEARLAAKRQLGNTTLVCEDVHRMNTVAWLEAIAADFGYAIRSLFRDRAFSIVAIATLALGVGANAALVSVAHAVLVKPLPYAAPDELYSAQIVIPERRDQFPSLPVPVQIFRDWRHAPAPFSGIAALRPWESNLTGGEDPERVGGARVSSNFFSVLGVAPALGRGFLAEEEEPGKENARPWRKSGQRVGDANRARRQPHQDAQPDIRAGIRLDERRMHRCHRDCRLRRRGAGAVRP